VDREMLGAMVNLGDEFSINNPLKISGVLRICAFKCKLFIIQK